jgi:drug/metabolite transporter (DMT)-like permease
MRSAGGSSAQPFDIARLLALATLWGASYSFIRVGVQTIPPVTLIAARTLIAAALLGAAMAAWRIPLPRDAATWRNFLVQALLNSVGPFTLIAWGQQVVEAGLATILNSTAPIFTFLITWAFTAHEPVSGRKLAGVIAGLAGVTLIIGWQALGGLGRELWSQLAIVGATICYAGAAIFGRNFAGLPPIVPAIGSMIWGAAILIPLSVLIDRPWALAPSAASLGALVGLSVFSTALAFLIYFRLLNTLGSVGTTAQAYVRVPIGVAIGAVFLGESLSPTVWIGLICVVLGVAAMTIPRRARQ